MGRAIYRSEIHPFSLPVSPFESMVVTREIKRGGGGRKITKDNYRE